MTASKVKTKQDSPAIVTSPWDRRDDESNQAYKAFRVYLELGADRTISAAYRAATKRGAEKPSGRWSRWVKRFKWDDRARAYDARQSFLANQAREEALIKREQEWARRREDIRDKGWTVGEALLAKAEQMLRLPIITQVNDVIQEERTDDQGNKIQVIIKRTIIKPARFSFGDAARLQHTAIELMRLSAGMSTDHVSADVMTMDALSSEALDGGQRDARLLELFERARARRDGALSAPEVVHTGADTQGRCFRKGSTNDTLPDQ